MHISEETRVKPVSADDSLELVDEDETDDLPSFLRR